MSHTRFRVSQCEHSEDRLQKCIRFDNLLDSLVLTSDLHLLYLVTPPELVDAIDTNTGLCTLIRVTSLWLWDTSWCDIMHSVKVLQFVHSTTHAEQKVVSFINVNNGSTLSNCFSYRDSNEKMDLLVLFPCLCCWWARVHRRKEKRDSSLSTSCELKWEIRIVVTLVTHIQSNCW